MQVTELPVRRWTQDYKEFLEGLIKPDTNEVLPAWMKRLHTVSSSKSTESVVHLWLSAVDHALLYMVSAAHRAPHFRLSTQAPLLVDFRDNSNEAEIKMTLQFASTAKAQVGA